MKLRAILTRITRSHGIHLNLTHQNTSISVPGLCAYLLFNNIGKTKEENKQKKSRRTHIQKELLHFLLLYQIQILFIGDMLMF